MARNQKGALEQRQREEWQLGIDWARWLLAGNQPQPLTIYGLVLEPGEVPYVHTQTHYSRLYRGSGRYTHSGGFFIGHPALVMGALAANAAVNMNRKAVAKRNTELMWRDLQEVPTVATNYRILTQLPGRGWLSFYYNSVQEFYPDPANWMINFGFMEAEPLRIAGLTAPTLSVLTAWCVLGDRWVGEPGIQPLLQAAAASGSHLDPGAVQGQIVAEQPRELGPGDPR
ncbi:hypothetical protein HPO96_29220 [Kribbella sandramycini]|uniref:Uncharacterized protein n=1 Tax=Kribbella sandramycini TaxID=60450 RepID=A0A7Y4L6J4_9ACTN|nr:hypothetical protein [Kribbella sandramycini]MBB6571692.1 hypothetical protein [Kribbella sandramycini]NOL44337.1 hypothetical protein [Kribbella sandramycini]